MLSRGSSLTYLHTSLQTPCCGGRGVASRCTRCMVAKSSHIHTHLYAKPRCGGRRASLTSVAITSQYGICIDTHLPGDACSSPSSHFHFEPCHTLCLLCLQQVLHASLEASSIYCLLLLLQVLQVQPHELSSKPAPMILPIPLKQVFSKSLHVDMNSAVRTSTGNKLQSCFEDVAE